MEVDAGRIEGGGDTVVWFRGLGLVRSEVGVVKYHSHWGPGSEVEVREVS